MRVRRSCRYPSSVSEVVCSAGIVPVHISPEGLASVFAAHMGGPFWAHKDPGAWSIAKGQYDPAEEDPLAAADREFEEEIGMPCPEGARIDLGEFRQRYGKLVRAYAVVIEERESVRFIQSNTFEMEWPRGSGRIQEFPEMDRAEWMSMSVARVKLLSGQIAIVDAVERMFAAGR